MKFFQKAAWEVGSNTILINYVYIYICSLTKSIEVHFSRSNIFLLYFWEKKSLAEVLLAYAEEKWHCRISSFFEKRKTEQLKQIFFKSVGFCKLQTTKNMTNFPGRDWHLLTIFILLQSIHRKARTKHRKGENQR